MNQQLYGYESTRILKYGEASLGPGQPLYYVDDEEADLEKLINAPLPKVPREISFTAHWLAIEGVQPSIPQNPTTSETRGVELLPKASSAATSNINPALAAMAGLESHSATTASKPLVKHHLSQELILYFERVTTSALSEDQPELRTAALASLREDPGLSQLLPYFVHYTADKVTHSLSHVFTLDTILRMLDSLSHNTHLNLAPYITSVVPVVLTCLTGRHIGPEPSATTTATATAAVYNLRSLASTLLSHLTKKYSRSAHNLKPRLARSCLKVFLDPKKPLGAHYGAILGLSAIGGAEVVRKLVVPNLKAYGELLSEISDSSDEVPGKSEADVRWVLRAVVHALATLVEDDPAEAATTNGIGIGDAAINGVVNGINGHDEDHAMTNGDSDDSNDELKGKLSEKIGEYLAGKILGNGSKRGKEIARALCDDDALFEDL
jgi:transcription initiation factor TFIID subunit 6